MEREDGAIRLGKWTFWNGFGEKEGGEMGKRVGIDMESKDYANISQGRKMNRI